MTQAQCLALVDRLNADPQMRELLNRPDPACPDGSTLASIGVPYTLAGAHVPAPGLAAIAVLSLIRSPLLSGAESVDLMDAWRALWAVTARPNDLACLHGLDARCEAIRRGCTLAGLPDEVAVKLQADAAAAAYAEVDRQALAVAARYPGATAQQVADCVGRMLADVMGAWAKLPSGRSGDEPNPQQAGHALTATGSQMWRTVRRWLGTLLHRPTFGTCPPPGLACRPQPG